MAFLLGLHKVHQALLVVYIYNLYLVSNGATTTTLNFVVKPGEGEEYVTTPVGRNATLECSVISTSSLEWRIDGFSPHLYDSELSGLTLHQIGPIRASTGEVNSTLTVNGAIQSNGIEICCQIAGPQQCCTNLIIYGRPASPENIAVQSINAGSIKITWDSESVAGIDLYYNINFTSSMSSIGSTEPFLLLNQSVHDVPCGTSLLISAVNGAGESSPSTFVLPSLPDIAPVTSLEHQVWKVNGDVLVRVSFEPAETCIYYPVKSYLLILQSLSGKTISFTLGCNETETFLNRLEDNKTYTYFVTAINTIGNATTDSEKVFTTSDVQNVTAIEVDEYTVKVHCYFINGSDAQGCLVVFNSNLTHVKSKYIELILMENDSIAWSVVNLAHPISCYHQVFAFDIETGGSISDLAIEGSVIINQSQAVCLVVTQASIISIIISCVMAAFVAATAVLVSICIIVAYHKRHHSTSGLKNFESMENSSSTIHPGISSGPNAQYSSNFQMKPNEAYEFWQVGQQPT